MKMKKVAPKNIVNRIMNNINIGCTNFICTPDGVRAAKNAILNIETVKQILNKNSKNFVSISYCEGILLIGIFNI